MQRRLLGREAEASQAGRRHRSALPPCIGAAFPPARQPTWDACSAEENSMNFTATELPHQRPAGGRRWSSVRL